MAWSRKAQHELKRAVQRGMREPIRAAKPTRRVAALPQAGGMRFHNTSGEAIPAYAVMRVTGSNTYGTEKRMMVAKPNNALQDEYLVNGPNEVAINEPGTGYYYRDIPGQALITPSAIPTFGTWWGPSNGLWHLVSGNPGFIIRGFGQSESGSNYRYAVQQIRVTEFWGKCSSGISKGNFGTIRIWWGSNPAFKVDSGIDLQVYAQSASITATLWCIASRIGDSWYVFPADCD